MLWLDSLRGSSVKIGTIQRILAQPRRKDDTHKSRSVNEEQTCHGRYDCQGIPELKFQTLFEVQLQPDPKRVRNIYFKLISELVRNLNLDRIVKLESVGKKALPLFQTLFN